MIRIPWSGIIGVLLGHTYYFFRDVIPLVYKHRQLPVPHYTQAPRWLYDFHYDYLIIVIIYLIK